MIHVDYVNLVIYQGSEARAVHLSHIRMALGNASGLKPGMPPPPPLPPSPSPNTHTHTHTVQRRKLQAATNLQAGVANGQSSFYTVTPQKSAAEPEEESSGDETDCGAWNWRENER